MQIGEDPRQPVDILSASLAEAVTEWASSPPQPENTARDETLLRYPVPGRMNHTLSFRVAPEQVEVLYDDGEPPGPAERLFTFPTAEAGTAIEEDVMAFVADLVTENVLLVREPLGKVTRLLRGQDAATLLWFRCRDDLTEADWRGAQRVYSWKGGFDKPSAAGSGSPGLVT